MKPSDTSKSSEPLKAKTFLEEIVARFLTGKNALLLLVLSLLLGISAILGTPREEEPQIVVPMADIFVQAPGYSAYEVENLVSSPMERLLWQLDGVEHVYSSSMRDSSVVTVRFFVGENREDSIIKLRNRLQQNEDIIPANVKSWIVKPIEIDDVPIVVFSLFGEGYDEYDLRRIGEEFKARLDPLPDLSGTQIVGGAPREVLVSIDRENLQGRGLSLDDVLQTISSANHSVSIGDFDNLNQKFRVSTGDGLQKLNDLGALTIIDRDGLPIYLRDVATLSNGPSEIQAYTRYGSSGSSPETFPSVSLAVSKKKGSDATQVAQTILKEAERLRGEVLPDGVQMVVTRNYGATADLKVNELLKSIAFALISVVALLLFTLGWREALVVALAVPMSFSLALMVNWLLGYTINRVTLFALILSLGLVVDDPITNVDNIQRHLRKGTHRPRQAILNAVGEVLPPVIMSTLAIIVSFIPMKFITGMMGPYMGPMAANVPLAVSFSTLAALSVVPWLAWVLLKKIGDKDQGMAKKAKPTSPFLKELYRVVVSPWIATRKRAWTLLGVVCLLFAGSMSLAALGKVPLKLLPYDNKDEFQIMLDMPEGTTLEHTDSVTRKFEAYLSKQPEVVNWQAFVGAASPMDFNGLVRHTYLRNSSELADIRITLLPKSVREMQSHAITLRMRNDLEKIAQSEGVVMRIVEVPPGPPVLATVTAEVYGSEGGRYQDIIDDARVLTERMSSEPGLVDLDILASEEHSRIHYSLDREQASIHGVEEKQTSRILSTALQGAQPGILRIPGERQVLPVKVRLPRDQRSDISALGGIAVRSSEGSLIALDEIGTFEVVPEDPVIYHKNLRPVVFVTGEMAGRPPAEAIFELQSWLKENPLPNTSTVEWAGEGEWEVTVRVFRDLGLAFGAAMVLIYLLLVIEIGSMILPLLVMMAIPLTAIGIMPGFWLLNVFFAEEVGGFQNGIYFTATAMIGMIALGGIVVRNSLVLMGFIGEARAKGASLREAIFESGAARIRPILLTAGTTALGAWPITLDPIFSGLAWSLIFGLIASTLFSLVVVPSTFFLLEERREKANQ